MDVSTGTNDDLSFRLGEMFDSYEELEQKLDRFSKQSLVHYWRRDSRTVSGAHMKTARPISERLKYYSVKYACIYGGQKFLPRGAGRRQSQFVSYFLNNMYLYKYSQFVSYFLNNIYLYKYFNISSILIY